MLMGGTGLGLLVAAACESNAASPGTSLPGGGGGGGTTVPGAIPEETAGPYPGDGSNGANVLNQAGIVRSDIRSSFGSSTTVATGVPLTIKLKILDLANASNPYEGAAVYLWHCDINGRYSLYSPGVTNENYLRGLQVADANGDVTFTSIFPACYSGRWPHIHFEVYPNVGAITSATNKIATSQLALPKATFDDVYASPGYATSISNASQVSLASDMVFSDGADSETPTVSGSVAAGYVASLNVPVT